MQRRRPAITAPWKERLILRKHIGDRLIIPGQNLSRHALTTVAGTYSTQRMRECSLGVERHAPHCGVCGDEGSESRAAIADAEIISAVRWRHVRRSQAARLSNGRYVCPVTILLPNARVHDGAIRRQRSRGILVVQLVRSQYAAFRQRRGWELWRCSGWRRACCSRIDWFPNPVKLLQETDPRRQLRLSFTPLLRLT